MTSHPHQLSPAQGQLSHKICVAVSAETPAALFASSADMLPAFPFQELRLDFLPDPASALSALRDHIRSHPQAIFLATCRRRASGGHFAGPPQAELQILQDATHAGCALVDLALETAEALGPASVQALRSAGAAVILSWHDFERTPDLDAVLKRMQPFSPDIRKVVPTATSLRDNLSLFALLNRRPADSAHLVGLCMGEAGIPSRVLGLRNGSLFTFAALDDGQSTAPGQVSARRLRDLFRIEQINPETAIYGVAGSPIASSLSPLMLNTAFARSGRNAVYLPLRTNDPAELFDFARHQQFQGLSVTMPLKETVLPFLRRVDPLAARIGAVNTLRRTPDGTFEGFNTDAAGIVAPLEARLNLAGARVLVLGAGGAARAAVFGCVDRGARVSILSRRPEQAAQLATEADAIAIAPGQLSSQPTFDVIINATPAGMRGNATALPLDPADLRARLVFDLVYNPLDTPLLQLARDRRIDTIPGVEMFVHQGARQYEIWTGEPAPVNPMREAVLNALTQP